MYLPDYIDHGCNMIYNETSNACVIQRTEEMFKNRVNEDPTSFAFRYHVVDTITILANRGDLVIVSSNSDNIREKLAQLINTANQNRHRVYSTDKAFAALDAYMSQNFAESEYKERLFVLEQEGANIHDLLCASEMQETIGERACLALIKRGLVGQDDVYTWEFDTGPMIDIPSWVNSRHPKNRKV